MFRRKNHACELDKAIEEAARPKCRVCGEAFTFEREKVYTARDEAKGLTAAFAGNPSPYYDAIDCPRCGCQKILCERKPRTDAQEAEEARGFGLNELAAEIHQNAVDHGWWEEPRGLPEILMLCVSELAEALEEHRDGHAADEIRFACKLEGVNGDDECDDKDHTCHFRGNGELCFEDGGEPCDKAKPEGVPIEIADCVIRILDYCGQAGIDIEQAIRVKHEYNKSRPYRHGGKVC